ncbi:MAG: CoA transferase [Actinobacteria bacterium]|nr:CoA transferase [Actinomycetota bacterium]
MRRPLDDVTILAIEQYGAGPWGTVHLADLGARIVKLEDPGSKGDIGRYVPPFQEGEDSLFFETFCHNKESISLDLRSAVGRATFERLVPHADAVFSNLRGDGPAKLRITYDDLGHLNPAIVCCSLSGFGMTGPRAAEGGYDYIAQGMAGWMSLTGDPDGPPTKSGLSLVDMSTGYAAALGMMCALWRARRDGTGCDVDVSLFETALNLDMYVTTWHLSRGWEPIRTRNSSHPSIVPFGNFPTADGWVVIACAKQKFFENLCGAIGTGWMLEDERFATIAARSEHRDACVAALEAVLRTNTTGHWVAALAAADVPSGPIYSIAEACADPQTVARDLIAATEHPVLGTVRQVRSPLRMPGAAEELRPAPKRGEHTRRVLHELAGMDDGEIDRLAEAGAFGDVEV